jgi:hypothetical protein
MNASAIRPTEEAYGELQQAYDFYNGELFGATLPPCLITFQRQTKTFGYFSKNRFGRRDGHKTDEIALNPEYFAVVPMIEVLQTLVHEMTHLWQEHFGVPSRACYHNTQWADKMERLGLMPSHTGEPGGKRVGQSIADYAIAGGLFEQATKRLLASGFAISWLDRFPATPPARFLYSAPAAGNDRVEVAGSATTAEAQAFASDGPNETRLSPSALQPDLIETSKTGNRSNRNKYSCPECSLNVWGKPGLRLMCVDCNVILSEG